MICFVLIHLSSNILYQSKILVMKKIALFTIALFACQISLVKAQSIFDKLDRLSNQVDNASNKIDKASNTATRASNTGGKVASLFTKKNKNKAENTSEAENKTVVKVSNISLANLKSLNAIIAGTKGVSDTSMKFNSATSSITVLHSGSSDELLENFQPKAKNIFTDHNIEGIEDGSIEIKLK